MEVLDGPPQVLRHAAAVALDHPVRAAERDDLADGVGALAGEQPGVDAAEALPDQRDASAVFVGELPDAPAHPLTAWAVGPMFGPSRQACAQ